MARKPRNQRTRYVHLPTLLVRRSFLRPASTFQKVEKEGYFLPTN